MRLIKFPFSLRRETRRDRACTVIQVDSTHRLAGIVQSVTTGTSLVDAVNGCVREYGLNTKWTQASCRRAMMGQDKGAWKTEYAAWQRYHDSVGAYAADHRSTRNAAIGEQDYVFQFHLAHCDRNEGAGLPVQVVDAPISAGAPPPLETVGADVPNDTSEDSCRSSDLPPVVAHHRAQTLVPLAPDRAVQEAAGSRHAADPDGPGARRKDGIAGLWGRSAEKGWKKVAY